MPTPEQLLKMTPKEVYGQAVRAGIEVAVKHSSIGLMTDGKDPLVKFYDDHPEFKDERVEPMLHAGSAESLVEVLRMVSEIPGWNTIVFNETGHGAEVYHVEPRSSRKQEQKQLKKRHGIFRKG